jgi:hypothetical protein
MTVYLQILLVLLVFYCFVLLYVRLTSKFTDLKDIGVIDEVLPLDTRYKFPLLSPVIPLVYSAEILDTVQPSSDLYSSQDPGMFKLLNQPQSGKLNELDYSGGKTQLIKIPLQINEPYNEPLRSQDILITPYNRIKYSVSGNCSAEN